MSYSITVNIDATGQVAVQATDRAGGASYHVASKHGGDLTGLSANEACRLAKKSLQWNEGLPPSWRPLRSQIEHAVAALLMCLPPPEIFDEAGRPVTEVGS